MRIQEPVLFENVAMDADRTSPEIDIEHAYGFAVELNTEDDGSAPTGNFLVQGSMGSKNSSGTEVWHTVDTIAYAANILNNYDGQYYKKVRVFWDRSTGDATDILNGKMFTKGA